MASCHVMVCLEGAGRKDCQRVCLNMRTSMTVGPLEAHAGTSWVSEAAECCAAELPSHPAALILTLLSPCSCPACISASVLAGYGGGRHDACHAVARKGLVHFMFAPHMALQARLSWQRCLDVMEFLDSSKAKDQVMLVKQPAPHHRVAGPCFPLARSSASLACCQRACREVPLRYRSFA